MLGRICSAVQRAETSFSDQNGWMQWLWEFESRIRAPIMCPYFSLNKPTKFRGLEEFIFRDVAASQAPSLQYLDSWHVCRTFSPSWSDRTCKPLDLCSRTKCNRNFKLSPLVFVRSHSMVLLEQAQRNLSRVWSDRSLQAIPLSGRNGRVVTYPW